MVGRSTILPCLASVPALALALGCGGYGGDGDVGATGTARSPIIAGTADTEHPAVVYIAVSGPVGSGACTGTIVQADPVTGIGYVLTAAHCLSGGLSADYVILGEDALVPTGLRYVALGSRIDFLYPGEPGYDMGLVRIVGVDETTPTIPLADPASDTVATGDRVTAVGYGLTLPDLHTDLNTVRHRLDMTVMETPAREIVVSGLGDICSGDSGGPILATIAGRERVVGVVDSSDPSCYLLGRASRVSPTFADELAPYAAQAVPDSCFRCAVAPLSGAGACVEVSRLCREDPGCTEIRYCVNSCGGAASCVDDCVRKPSHSRELFLAREHCACDPCADICSGNPIVCPPVPRLPVIAPSLPPFEAAAPRVAADVSGGCAVTGHGASRGAGRAGGLAWYGFAVALSFRAVRRVRTQRPAG